MFQSAVETFKSMHWTHKLTLINQRGDKTIPRSTPSKYSSSHKKTQKPPASQTNANANNGNNTTAIIPTPAGLKPSYLILDEAIPFPNAFGILGRLVADVKRPLYVCSPMQVVAGAKIPHVPSTPPGNPTNQTPSAGEVSEDEVDFLRELEKYKSTLVFSNLPFTISSCARATITHRSQYSRKTSSLLKAVLGISISSSTTSATTYCLDSSLIRTLSLTQHDIVWAALLSHEQYKKDVMAAVRRNGGKMFLVIGVKEARDAEVRKETSRGKAVGGKLHVDVGDGVGAQGLAMVPAGKDGERTSMGVLGSQMREMVDESSRKERLLGDRGFAVEYKEVRLKLKLEMRGWGNRVKRARETGNASKGEDG